MTALYLYDDALARTFAPFALTRPGAELRVGALLVRERWARALGAAAAGFVSSPHLAGLEEPGSAPAAAVLPAGAIVANARCAPALDAVQADGVARWRCGGHLAAVRLGEAVPRSALADGARALDALPAADGAATELGGWWHDAVWDYVGHLGAVLARDLPALGAGLDVAEHPGLVLGAGAAYVERGATVEPYAVFDTSAGPVVIRRGATVQAFTRVVGPCYVGEHSLVTADRVSGCAIGDHCKTGIGLTLTTGTVVGAGANVYDRMPPKHVPPFAWGGGVPYDAYDAERFLRVAERAMARRQRPLSAGVRELLARAHALSAGERAAAG